MTVEGAPLGLVGRDEELHRLGAAILSGRPVTVVGEAGIGKTTLVRAAATSIGVPLHEGGGFATLVSMPYLALRRAVGVELDGDPARLAELIERSVGPDLLFIDDLQWVDDDSLRVIALLGGRVLLATAIRTGDPRSGIAARSTETIGAEVLALGGLDDSMAPAIVRRVRPTLPDAVVEQVVARAGGNPLVLEEMAQRGAPSPILARAIEAGFDALSTGGRDVVSVLAIADRPLSRDRLGPALDEPLEHGLIIDRAGLVQVRHALLAEAIRDRLDGPDRSDLHRRVAGLVDDPAEAARHLAAAGDPAGARATASAALPDVDDPVRRAALLVIVAESSDPADLVPRLAAGRALADLSRWEGVVAILGDGGDAAGDAAGVSSELLAERGALLAHGTYALGRHEEARRLLADAATLPIDPTGSAAARLTIETASFMVNVDGGIGPALALLDDALTRRPAASPDAMGLRAIREAVALLGVQDADIGFLRASVDAAIAAGAYASAADLARVVSFALLMWTGAEADLEFLDHTGRRFDAAGVAEVGLELLAERVQAAVLAGHLDDAVAFGDEILERPAPLRARQAAAMFRARALALMGRLDEAQAGLAELGDRVTDDFVGRGELLAVRAEIALWGGLAERAIELATEVRTIPSPILNAYGLTDLTRAWARLELGLAPGPLDGVVPTRIMAGAIPESIAMTDLSDGRAEAAAHGFAQAASLWHGFHEPRAMFCRWAEGEALRRAGRDDEMAVCLGSVLEEATAGGYGIIALRARRSLRQAGVRTAADRPAMTGGRRLTARELELLDLVGRGLTNIEIARRMGLGRPTVSRMLSNAMSKLGASSRAQAVVLAADSD